MHKTIAIITQKNLTALKIDQHGETIRDDGGLYGRVRAKGSAVSVSFYYRYRWESKLKDISCGTWPSDSLSVIRGRRDDARRLVSDDFDPSEDKKIVKLNKQAAVEARIAESERNKSQALTLNDMFEEWIENGVRRKDGNAELLRIFKKDPLPVLGSKKVKDITESDLRNVLKKMVARNVNRAAVVMRNNLVQMFAWAEKRQPWRKLLIEGNPAELIEIDKITSPDYDDSEVRKRRLSEAEIKELRAIFIRMNEEYANAINRRSTEHPVINTTQLGVWIMLSTMCRVGEMLKSRWENVDLVNGIWFIPRADVKDNVSDLIVHLSDFALKQFQQLKNISGESEWCFPSRNNAGHVDIKSITKQIGDRQSMFKKDKDGNPRQQMKGRKYDNSLVLAAGQFGAWTPHDLRRTGSTAMQMLKVPLHIIDCCQNHVLPGSKVRRHYMHHEYEREMKLAWKKLGQFIEKVLRE